MPTCRRKRVLLTEPSDSLLQAARTDPNKHVFYLERTGEIFETYEYVFSLRLLSPASSDLIYKGLCRAYVFLPSEAIPMRSHWQKRLGLLPGCRE